MQKRAVILSALVAVTLVSLAAQTGGNVSIRVAETAGMRRTEYPVRARVRLPERAVADATHVQLRVNNMAVPAQYSVQSKWPDGSAQSIDVAFNVTLNPGEVRAYQLAFGGDVTAAAAPPRGLMVTDDAGSIQIGTVKFNKSGSPLVTSVSYVRSEFIGSFAQARNGFSITDKAGTLHDLSSAQSLKTEILERGPLLAVVQYSGNLPVDGASVPFTLTVEMPNSKSWMKVTAAVTDTGRRVRDLAFDSPLAFGAFPWQWDVSTENGTYGAFRNATDKMLFTQVIPDQPQGQGTWKAETGTGAELRLAESSVSPAGAASRPRPVYRSGHIQGSTTAVAFAIDGMSDAPGTYSIALDGQGQASYRFVPAAASTSHRLVVYQHFVSTPVAIGAATSPASMLQPPLVTVE